MLNTSKTINPATTIVFIDAGVENADLLIEGVIPTTEVFVLDGTADGIEQISLVLQHRQNIDAVHIISHGSPGCLYLGNSQLSLDTLIHYAPQLQKWDVANLLLYGCNVAAGDAGAEFITKLQTLTGAEIAASKTLTGSAAKGGNWELEVTTGQAELTAAFSPEVMATYPGVMSIVADTEPNNTIATAQVIPASSFSLDYRSDIQTLGGTNISTSNPHVTILGTGDGTRDYYRFDALAGQQFIFDIDGNTNFDSDLYLHDINGNQLAYNDDLSEIGETGNGLNSFITYTFSNSGSYFINVGRLSNQPLPSGSSYTLHFVSNDKPTDLNLSNTSINENVAANTTVGTFTSTDPNTGNPFTYSLVAGTGDTNNSAFSIVSNELRINASPDFETKSTYNIRVRTTDAGGLTYDKPLVVNINDIDEFVNLTPNNDLFQGTGTASADQINGLPGSDRLYGNAGNDTINGGDGDDVVYGGNDNDLLRGGNGSDRLYGDAGNDELLGEVGNDILYGGDGDDLLNGGAGSDQLYGNAGIDTFVLASGMGLDSIYNFQDGVDRIRLDGGLTFGALQIAQSGTSTLIKIASTGETLASLINTNSALIGASDFSGSAPVSLS
ncbi:DUF4347 domain-containing protein [Microcoleus sp. F6_B4]